MFSLGSIWNRGIGRRLAVVVLSLLLSLVPLVAQASGESYAWKDASHSAIIGSGGSYSGNVSFNKSGKDYVATAPSFTCSDGSTQAAAGTSKLSGSGTSYSLDNSKLTIPKGCTIDPLDTSVTVGAVGSTSSSASSNTCDQGSVTWFACPVMENLASTITTFAASALQEVLEISPLKSGAGSPIYQTWASLRDLADVSFIIIFLLIIFSTSIQQGFDQYTVRKMLPRLVLAVILVQLSFFLAGALVDLGNVLGHGVNDLLVSALNPTNPDTKLQSLFTNIAEISTSLAVAGGVYVAFSHGFWVAAMPILLGILLSLVVVLVTLGMRYIIIALLIILSPLAMVAWVLPNTEKYFHKWLSALLRLVMMYPIIMAILSVASHLNDLLPFGASGLTTTPGSILVAIMKPLIIIGSLALVPFTFRWAGAAVGNAHNLIQQLSGRAGGALKKSDLAAAGRMQRSMNRNEHMLRRQNRALMLRDPEQAQKVMAQSNALRRNTTDRFQRSWAGRKTHGARMFTRGLALGTTASSGMTMQRAYNTQFKDRVKALGDLEESEATYSNLQTAIKGMYGSDSAEKRENMDKLRRTAPSLMNFTNTVQGRAAIIRKLSDMKGIDDDLTRRMMEDKKGMYEYNQFIGGKAAKAEPKEKPTITFARSFDPEEPQNTKLLVPLVATQVQKLSVAGFSNDFDTANWTAATGRVVGKDDSKTQNLYQRDDLSKSIAQAILDNASYGSITATFDSSNRNFSDAAKRAAIVRMLHDNEDLATEGNARLVRDNILKTLVEREVRDPSDPNKILDQKNTDIYDLLIEQAVRSDGFKGSLAGFGDNDTIMAHVKSWGNDESGIDQKRAFLRNWLNLP